MTAVSDNETIDPLEMEKLGQRVGCDHLEKRLAFEKRQNQKAFWTHGKLFHLENSFVAQKMMALFFRALALHERGARNASSLVIRENEFFLPDLPNAFDGFRILHLSDLHVDMVPSGVEILTNRLQEIDYDICVMTGDYRGKTYGPIDHTISLISHIKENLHGQVFAVLGNHDSIGMVPFMERMDIDVLLNESVLFKKEGQTLFIGGIDDAHYFQAHDIEASLKGCPSGIPKILLSHTPEVYRQAAQLGYDVFLCGHTHGGQICLPGGIPLTLESRCPRHMGSGAWQHEGMSGYTNVGSGTSIINLRFNCPPEIAIHTLRKSGTVSGHQ
jgi:hypothetical protein